MRPGERATAIGEGEMTPSGTSTVFNGGQEGHRFLYRLGETH